MITARTKIFAISGVAVLVILAVILIIITVNQKSDIPPTSEAETITEDVNFLPEITVPQATDIPSGATVKPLTTEEMMQNAAKQISKIFIERYGSYSSESAGQNIREVEDIVSQKLWAEISQRIGVAPVEEFIGISTKAIAVDLVEYNSEAAITTLGLIRTVTKGDVVESKTERVKLILVRDQDNGWLVDSVEWQ